jgi:hypothetical protein
VSPVTEDEIRSVLLAVAPVTTQDLVSRFKSRLRGPEVGLFDTILMLSSAYLLHMCQFLVILPFLGVVFSMHLDMVYA